jgi:2-methylfumaryl-CoA isomerase
MLEAAHDPKLVGDNPIFGDSANPSGLAYPAAGAFATIPQLDRAPPRPAPRLGADTDAVLAEVLGLSSGEIGKLHDAGIVAQA